MSVTGQRVPSISLGRLDNGEVRRVGLEMLTAGQRVIIVGVPGAFTPVCTSQHVPDFVANAERLKASGFTRTLCIGPNDPWTMSAWAREVDPDGKLEFLSDGNLELSRAMGLTVREPEMFLGERSRRYLMVVNNSVIERLNIEPRPLGLTCTRASNLIEI